MNTCVIIIWFFLLLNELYVASFIHVHWWWIDSKVEGDENVRNATELFPGEADKDNI